MINWYTNLTNRAFVIMGYEAKTAPRCQGAVRCLFSLFFVT